MRIERLNDKLSQADLDRFERELPFGMPGGYRTFLLGYNGGIPYNNTFDVPSPANDGRFLYSFVIRKFLGLTSRGADDLLRTRQNLNGRLPPAYLPIAIDNFRNFMCLDLRTGEVAFFDLQSVLKAEKTAQGEPVSLAPFLYPVAHSFDEMLDELYHKKFS
jgi:hypothetical protein